MKGVMVAMRDGVKLATDIYRPGANGTAADGKFPALLERTPYGKGGARVNAAAPYHVPRGYVLAVQGGRGRYQSEGRWRPIVDDPKDGSDTAAWIGAQPWSDGGIGTMGSSYGGATQHALAIGNAPFVKAMVPRNAMSDFGRYGVRHNGAFELRWFNWVLTMGNAAPGTTNAPAAAARAASDPAAAAALLDLGSHVRDFVTSPWCGTRERPCTRRGDRPRWSPRPSRSCRSRRGSWPRSARLRSPARTSAESSRGATAGWLRSRGRAFPGRGAPPPRRDPRPRVPPQRGRSWFPAPRCPWSDRKSTR